MPRGNILVVDDDENVRRLLMECLKQQSPVDVDGARDGVEALHQVALKRYAVIVLDVMMPHMSGVDFLSSLEALASDPSVKALETTPAVLVITSMQQEDIRAEHIQQRFPRFVRAVVRKPLDVHVFARQVAALVR